MPRDKEEENAKYAETGEKSEIIGSHFRLFRLISRISRSTLLPTHICIIFLALLPLAFFWRETLGWLTLGDQDAVFWFYPAYKFVAEQIKSGSFPLWTPYLYSGMPMFAQWQAGVLDPINWIYLIEASSRTLTLSLEMSFSISLIATFCYTRILGFERRACVFAAVIYALSGFAVGRSLYPGFLHIIALTPFVLYFVERLRRTGRWMDVTGGASIVAWQIFAAHPQPLIYSSLLAGVYALSRIPNVKFLAQFSVMFIAGAGLASIQLLPAWEVAKQSVRQQWPYELFTLHSLHPVSLLTALFPFFHGSGKTIYHLPYWGGYWHHNEAQIYLGVPAISLAIAGAIFAWRCRYGIGIFWSVIAILGVMLSLGKYSGPIARMLYHVPVISQFRSPNRHWMEVALAVAVLAGYAVNRLLTEKSRPLARYAQLTSVLLASMVCFIGGFVLWRKDLAEDVIRRLPDLGQMPQGFLQSANAEFYLPMTFAVCATLALMIFVRSRQRGKWYVLLFALLLVDYNLYSAFAPINNPAKLETLVGRAMPESLAAKQNINDPIRYHVILDEMTGEFSPFWFYGHEMATGYDPMLNERYKTFSGIDEAGRSYNKTMLEPQDRTLDILNVKYVLVPPSNILSIDTSRWREVEERSQVKPYRDYRVFENLRSLPRVWLVGHVKTAYEGDQIKLIRGETASNGDREFDPRTTALVDHETAAKLDLKSGQGTAETNASYATIVERKPTRMLIETGSADSSVLVMSQNWSSGWQEWQGWRGWRAIVDGKNVELMRVNYNLRGVALPAGKHGIEIGYRPDSLKLGAVVSITTALSLFLIVLWERRSKIGSREIG